MKRNSQFIWEKKTDRELQFWPGESVEHYLAAPTLPEHLVKRKRRSRISAPPALELPVIENLGILNAAKTRHKNKYYQARADENFHFLLYTTDGKCSLKLGKKEIKLGRNSLFLAPAASEYEFKSEGKWHNIWFHIEAAKEWNSIFGETPTVKKSLRLPELKFAVDMYLKESYSESRSISVLQTYAELIVLLIKDEFKIRRIAPENREAFFISLKNRIAEPLTAKSVAKELLTTPRKLNALFQKRFSQTFAKYLFSLRMKKACELLENGVCTVEETAKAAGFANKHSLSKAFKKHYGRPPASMKPRRA